MSWARTGTFQRARSEEQRQVRRRAVLDTMAALVRCHLPDPALPALHLDLRGALEVALTAALLGVLPRT